MLKWIEKGYPCEILRQAIQEPEARVKDLEQFVKNPVLLQTGRPLKQFGNMLPREVLANWLLCATVNAVERRQLVFSSDPTGGDGIIWDKTAHEIFPTEPLWFRD